MYCFYFLPNNMMLFLLMYRFFARLLHNKYLHSLVTANRINKPIIQLIPSFYCCIKN